MSHTTISYSGLCTSLLLTLERSIKEVDVSSLHKLLLWRFTRPIAYNCSLEDELEVYTMPPWNAGLQWQYTIPMEGWKLAMVDSTPAAKQRAAHWKCTI